MKTKIRSYGDEAVDFYSRKIHKVIIFVVCWLLVLIYYVLQKNENYYLQVFLKECKHTEKEKQVIRWITNDLKYSSDDSSESDKEYIMGYLLKMQIYACKI